jgi:hypothetical protein
VIAGGAASGAQYALSTDDFNPIVAAATIGIGALVTGLFHTQVKSPLADYVPGPSASKIVPSASAYHSIPRAAVITQGIFGGVMQGPRQFISSGLSSYASQFLNPPPVNSFGGN